MENRDVARILRETAKLLEIDGAIIGRYRSYEKAADLIASLTDSIEEIARDLTRLTALPGIGDRMAEHICEILNTGDYSLRAKLLKKYPLQILGLLKLQSLGPKKACLLWEAFQVSSVEQVEQLALAGKLRDLPGFGKKTEENILKSIEVYKKTAGRFLITFVERESARLIDHILNFNPSPATPHSAPHSPPPVAAPHSATAAPPHASAQIAPAAPDAPPPAPAIDPAAPLPDAVPGGFPDSAPEPAPAAAPRPSSALIASITPAGSLRRCAETVGDLDLLLTLTPGPHSRDELDALAQHILAYGPIEQLLARGENKISFRLASNLQVDVRLLAPENFGAALIYFTGSKEHNVALRSRALKLGYTLNEYALATLPPPTARPDPTANPAPASATAAASAADVAASFTTASALDAARRVAGATEHEVYAALHLDFIPPELRENTGEIEAAAEHRLPRLIEQADLRGDLQMHTTASDGRHTIEDMAAAARQIGYEYIAITDHSKALSMVNGLDNARALAHARHVREVDAQFPGLRILAGIKVDILKDGTLDLDDEVLAQLDIVVASIHSFMRTERSEMTERMLAAVEHPQTQIIGHPTGRLLLRRDAFAYDLELILDAARKHGVAFECNAAPDRLDLKDVYLRMARDRGVPIVISTDAHSTRNLGLMRYGVQMARRGWLRQEDVLNTLPLPQLLAALRTRPGYSPPADLRGSASPRP